MYQEDWDRRVRKETVTIAKKITKEEMMENGKTELEAPEKAGCERSGDRLKKNKTAGKNKSIIRGPFIPLPLDVFRSEAMKGLNGQDLRILIWFLLKQTWSQAGKGRQSRTVHEKSGLVFNHTEAASMGIESHAFYRAIKQLIEVGFIDQEHQGGTSGNDPSRYAISERWRD